MEQGNIPHAAASNGSRRPGVERLPQYHFVSLTEVGLLPSRPDPNFVSEVSASAAWNFAPSLRCWTSYPNS
jgi:hypothetical protein